MINIGDLYRHFKPGGATYEVVDCDELQDTNETLIGYRKVDEPDGCIYWRTEGNFEGEVERDGYKGPRFIRVGRASYDEFRYLREDIRDFKESVRAFFSRRMEEASFIADAVLSEVYGPSYANLDYDLKNKRFAWVPWARIHRRGVGSYGGIGAGWGFLSFRAGWQPLRDRPFWGTEMRDRPEALKHVLRFFHPEPTDED